MRRNNLVNSAASFNNPLVTITRYLTSMLFFLLLIPTCSWAEMYVGGYFGGNFGLNTNPGWDAHYWAGTKIIPQQYPRFGKEALIPRLTFPAFSANNIGVDPSFMVGGKFGYWFSREGALKANYPNFMKYIGLELDISYNALNWGRQDVVISPVNYAMKIENSGFMVTAALLVMGRYGFLPDKEVPFGRLQPYLGIGPAIVVTKTFLNIGHDYVSSDADLGFMVETGLRYMIRKNFSIAGEFKYRYARIHADVDDQIFGRPYWLYAPMYATYNLFSFTLGVAYHF
jgi:opacity protein-like surface antigen